MKRTARTAVADFIIGILSTIIAHALALLPVEKAREYLKSHLKLGDLKILPAHIAGIELPVDFLRSAGGSIAGYTVAEIVKKIYPSIGDDMEDYLQDLTLMVAEKYADLMAEKGIDTTTATTSGSAPQSGVERMRMATYRNWLISSVNPLICVCADCPKDHHRELKNVPVGGGGGRGGAPARTEPKMVPRPEFKPIGFVDIMATPGVHPPVDDTEGGGRGCNCPNAFAADKKTYDREEVAVAPPAPKKEEPKPGKERSFADFQGEALTSPDDKLHVKAEALRDMLVMAGLTAEEHAWLNRCNTMNEYLAIANCTTPEQLKALLPSLVAHSEVNVVGRVLEEIGIGEDKARRFVEKLQSESKTRTVELRRQREVLAFCVRSNVYREEVLAVTPTKNRVEDLSLDDVKAAILIDPASKLSPVMAYREQNKPQPKTKPAKPAKSAGPGRVRRFAGWLYHLGD